MSGASETAVAPGTAAEPGDPGRTMAGGCVAPWALPWCRPHAPMLKETGSCRAGNADPCMEPAVGRDGAAMAAGYAVAAARRGIGAASGIAA